MTTETSLDDDLLIYYSGKYIYVNITHTNKYVLIIHYTQPYKAYQSLVANTYKLIVLQIHLYLNYDIYL